MLALQEGLYAVFRSSRPAIDPARELYRELSLTPTQPNVAHPSSECIAHSPALHPQQGPGGFRPNTFEGAGTHVWPHPHKVDASSRASQPTISSTTRQQIQGSPHHQTHPRHHQSLTYPSHMAHQATHDYGLLLPGIGYGSANLILQALLS